MSRSSPIFCWQDLQSPFNQIFRPSPAGLFAITMKSWFWGYLLLCKSINMGEIFFTIILPCLHFWMLFILQISDIFKRFLSIDKKGRYEKILGEKENHFDNYNWMSIHFYLSFQNEWLPPHWGIELQTPNPHMTERNAYPYANKDCNKC